MSEVLSVTVICARLGSFFLRRIRCSALAVYVLLYIIIASSATEHLKRNISYRCCRRVATYQTLSIDDRQTSQ